MYRVWIPNRRSAILIFAIYVAIWCSNLGREAGDRRIRQTGGGRMDNEFFRRQYVGCDCDVIQRAVLGRAGPSAMTTDTCLHAASRPT